MKDLLVTSPDFSEGGWISKKHSAWGENISPELNLFNIDENGVSIAITLDDASHPLFPNYNHWIIWNIPVMNKIPENIPKGEKISVPFEAVQGKAYGNHCYKGPKPPFKAIHTYVFTVYILDCKLELPSDLDKTKFMKETEGHILQKASLSGKFQNHRKENI